MRHFLSSLPYPNKDPAVVARIDPLIVGAAEYVIVADIPALIKVEQSAAVGRKPPPEKV